MEVIHVQSIYVKTQTNNRVPGWEKIGIPTQVFTNSRQRSTLRAAGMGLTLDQPGIVRATRSTFVIQPVEA